MVTPLSEPVRPPAAARHLPLGPHLQETDMNELPLAPKPSETTVPGWTEADTVSVTPGAIESIRELREEYGESDWGLRYGITGGGCSGYKYLLEFEEAPKSDDLVFEHGDVRVFVSKDHMAKLKNSVIDWKDSLMESGFDISNPQAKRPCGCGESVDF
jgi:iron-sulfur cluster assembly accessory protein